MKIIEVKQSVFADNNRDADALRLQMKEEKPFLVNLMSSPGSGKTTLLQVLAEKLRGKVAKSGNRSLFCICEDRRRR